jgi:hypothetical protein
MLYCDDCKNLYGLNNRISRRNNSECKICGKKSIETNFCTNTKVDEELGIVIWKEPKNIQIKVGERFRNNTILISKFKELTS